MRQCPKCQKRTLDFDDYFGRFRCLNAECGWMVPSSAEREIRRLRSCCEPHILHSPESPGHGLKFAASYDSDNDAFSVDFGREEPTFDLPEPDGRMIWRVVRQSREIAGFTIVGIRELGIVGIQLAVLVRKKKAIENRLSRFSRIFSQGQVTRDVIDQVIVAAKCEDETASDSGDVELEGALQQVLKRAEELAGSGRT